MNGNAKPALPVNQIRRKRKFDIFPYAIAAPALIILLLGMLYPMLWAIFNSFTDKKLGVDSVNFIGLENYRFMLTNKIYLGSIVNTIRFTLFAMVTKVFLGVVVALILNMNLKFRNMFRSVFLLPWTLPGVVAIYIWMWLYTGNGGLINNLLGPQLGLLSQPVGWLSNPNIAIYSLAMVNTWRGVPFIAISVLAGLQTIPQELYESASIDGAGTLRSFRHITLPLIVPVVLVSSLISTIWTLNDFETVWLLTAGGPGQSTYTIPIAAYKQVFDGAGAGGMVGRSAAAALITVPFLIVLMIPILNNMLGEDERKLRQHDRAQKKRTEVKGKGD